MSCVVIVRLDHSQLRGPYALKLYDRRHASGLREDEELPWTAEIESAYQDFVADGLAEPFFRMCESKYKEDEFWASDGPCDGWSEGQKEAYLQYLCWRTYDTERHAYCLLQDLQGTHVPRVYDHPYVQAFSRSKSVTFNKYLDSPGLLLEYVPGYALTDLADRAPKADWQSICEEAIHIVHLVGKRGVINRDVKTRNIMVHRKEGSKRYRVVMLDFGLCYFRSQAKDDTEFREWQADQDEEGAVGKVMWRKLEGGFKYRISAYALRLLYEFKSE